MRYTLSTSCESVRKDSSDGIYRKGKRPTIKSDILPKACRATVFFFYRLETSLDYRLLQCRIPHPPRSGGTISEACSIHVTKKSEAANLGLKATKIKR